LSALWRQTNQPANNFVNAKEDHECLTKLRGSEWFSGKEHQWISHR